MGGHFGASPLQHRDSLRLGVPCRRAVNRLNLPNSLRLFGAQITPEWVLDVVASLDDRPKPQSDWNSESNLGTYQCRVWKPCVSHWAHTNAPMFVHVLTYTLINLHDHFFVFWLSTATHLLPDLVTQLHTYTLTSLCVYLLLHAYLLALISFTCLPSQVLTQLHTYLLTLPFTCVATYTITYSDPITRYDPLTYVQTQTHWSPSCKDTPLTREESWIVGKQGSLSCSRQPGLLSCLAPASYQPVLARAPVYMSDSCQHVSSGLNICVCVELEGKQATVRALAHSQPCT